MNFIVGHLYIKKKNSSAKQDAIIQKRTDFKTFFKGYLCVLGSLQYQYAHVCMLVHRRVYGCTYVDVF